MYYKLFNPITKQVEYWHGEQSRAGFLFTIGSSILPLGTRKPKNVSRETIKEF